MLDGQTCGEDRMVAKRKLMKILPILSITLVSLFLVIAGFLVYFYYHNAFGDFLSFWFVIVGLSLVVIAGSHVYNKMMRDPNIMRQYKTTPSVKRDVNFLAAALLFNTIVASLDVFWLLGHFISSGNIAKPIYDLMFATALAVYTTAGIYNIWEGKKHH